jgi:hypothetical protein
MLRYQDFVPKMTKSLGTKLILFKGVRLVQHDVLSWSLQD